MRSAGAGNESRPLCPRTPVAAKPDTTRFQIGPERESLQPRTQLQATPYSLFPIPSSLFPVPYSLFPRPYPSNRRITSVVFAPPKPKELLITTSSSAFRAVWGT